MKPNPVLDSNRPQTIALSALDMLSKGLGDDLDDFQVVDFNDGNYSKLSCRCMQFHSDWMYACDEKDHVLD